MSGACMCGRCWRCDAREWERAERAGEIVYDFTREAHFHVSELEPAERFPGVTYDANGAPMFLSDQRAHDHLRRQGGRHCSPPCDLCRYVQREIKRQERGR